MAACLNRWLFHIPFRHYNWVEVYTYTVDICLISVQIKGVGSLLLLFLLTTGVVNPGALGRWFMKKYESKILWHCSFNLEPFVNERFLCINSYIWCYILFSGHSVLSDGSGIWRWTAVGQATSFSLNISWQQLFGSCEDSSCCEKAAHLSQLFCWYVACAQL